MLGYPNKHCSIHWEASEGQNFEWPTDFNYWDWICICQPRVYICIKLGYGSVATKAALSKKGHIKWLAVFQRGIKLNPRCWRRFWNHKSKNLCAFFLKNINITVRWNMVAEASWFGSEGLWCVVMEQTHGNHHKRTTVFQQDNDSPIKHKIICFLDWSTSALSHRVYTTNNSRCIPSFLILYDLSHSVERNDSPQLC